MKNHSTQQEFRICSLLLLLGLLLFSSLYFNSIYPVTEGWGIYYVELLERDMVPYRDFYYYLTPLNLLIETVLWKLSFGSLLIFRGWYLLERILLVFLFYKLLTRWFAPRYVWFPSLMGAVLRNAVVWDLMGDYNQTQTLLIVFLTYAIVNFLEKDADSVQQGWKHYRYIFEAGLVLATLVLLKQSAGLAAVLVCFLFLVAYCIVFHDKRFGWYCLATAVGAAIPLGFCFGWLAIKGAFFPFLDQMFGTAGAKGGIGTVLFTGFKVLLTNWGMDAVFLSLVLLFWGIHRFGKKKDPDGRVVIPLSCILVITTMIGAYQDDFKIIAREGAAHPGFLLALLLIVALAVFSMFGKRTVLSMALSRWNFSLLTIMLFLFMYLLMRFNVDQAAYSMIHTTKIFEVLPAIATHLILDALILGTVAGFVVNARAKKTLYPKPVLFLFAGALIDAYANMMNSSTDVYPVTLFLAAPLVLTVLLSYVLPHANHIKNIITIVLCIAICGTVMAQKSQTPYSWWGTSPDIPIAERTEKVAIPAFRGMRVNLQTKLNFEVPLQLIEENDREDSTVWGFPHVKIFNVLSRHYDLNDPVPVPFYDVCSDEAALQEVEYLRENLPDFIVWCDMPYCVEVHEDIFRGGKPLGHRKIIEWFQEVRETEYTKIGQVGNLFVYMRNNGDPIRYTYFQYGEENSVNITGGEGVDTGLAPPKFKE